MKILRLLFFVCLFLIQSNIGFGQFLEPLNGPSGISVREIAGTDGTIYINTQRKIYRSSDDGTTWEIAMNGIPADNNSFTELTAGSDGNIYVIGNSGFFILRQGQNFWEKKDIPNLNFFSQISVNPDGVIYVCHRNSGLYRAESDTSDFQKIFNAPSTVNDLRAFGNGLNFILFGFGLSDKIMKVSDDGTSSQVIEPEPVGIGQYNDLDLLPDGRLLLSNWGGILISDDGGETWEEKEIHPDLGNPNVFSAHVQPSTGDIFYLTDFGIWRTQNVNQVSTLLSEPPFDKLQKPFAVNEFAKMDFADPSYIYLAQLDEFFLYSDDDGQNWGHADSKFKKPFVQKILKDSEDNLFAQTRKIENIEMSSDAGGTWEGITVNGDKIKSFAIHQNGDFFALVEETHFYKSVHRSENKGLTWTELTFNISVSPNYSDIAVTADGTVWLNHEDGLMFSKDLGENWESLNFPTISSLFPPAVHPNGNIYVNSSVGSLFTEDGGENWALTLSLFDTFEPPYISESGKVYLIGSGNSGFETGIMVSDEDGADFNPLPFLPDQLVTFFRLNILEDCDGNLILSDLNRILLSLDSGNSWINIGFGIEDGTVINDIYLDESNFLYVGMSNDVIHKSKEPTCDFTKTKTTEFSDLNIQISPNPMSDFALINIENEIKSTFIFRVFDVVGKEIRTDKFNSNQFKFQKGSLNSGIYVYQIESENQILKTGKLIIK